MSWFVGVSNLFSHILIYSKREKINQKYSYFFNLDKTCFPSSRDKDSYDVMSWYTKKYNVNNSDNSRLIVHSVPNISNNVVGEHNIMYAQDCFPKISFFAW